MAGTAPGSKDFLLVIPAFEESGRLPPFLEALAAALAGQPFQSEIRIVDDGSCAAERERLVRAVQPLREKFDGILDPLFLHGNSGKGAAILAGWRHRPDARWLAFADADGAVSPAEISRVFGMIFARGAEAACVFGSRVKMLGRVIERSTMRHFIGRIFASMVGNLIDPRVYDAQCGFKIISRRAFAAIDPLLVETGFAFDVELMCALLDSGFRIEEVPVDWSDVPGSKVSLVRDTLRMFFSLQKIRARRARWTFAKAGGTVAVSQSTND